MKQINLSGLILEELIRVRLNEKDRDLSQWDVDPKTDEDGWDVTPAGFDAKTAAKKLYSFKGSFFGGRDLEDAYATYIVKNISSATDWDKTDKELKKLSSGKGIISYGRSFINDDEVSVWNPILKHVQKIYKAKLPIFVKYLGADTYQKFLPNASQDTKSIAQEIYDSESWHGDNEAQLIAAIKKISNAAAWKSTNTQLQILTGEKGIISYIGSFIGHNDTATWNPILLHMKKAKLVPGKVLNYIVKKLGGPTLYPGIMDEAAEKEAVESTIKKIQTDNKKNNNTFGGETAISWGLAILGYLGLGVGTFFMLLRPIGKSLYRSILKAAGKEVVVKAERPWLLKRGFYKLEQFISNGILGNTGSLRRLIRQMQHENLITPEEAREAMALIKTNRYAIASEIRKTYMREVIAKFAERGNKSEITIKAIKNGIPTSGPGGLELRSQYEKILKNIAEKEKMTYGETPRPAGQGGKVVYHTTTTNP